MMSRASHATVVNINPTKESRIAFPACQAHINLKREMPRVWIVRSVHLYPLHMHKLKIANCVRKEDIKTNPANRIAKHAEPVNGAIKKV